MQKITPGTIGLLFLYGIPLVWWVLVQPEENPFSGITVTRTIAKLSAIAAMVSFAVAPLLSVRMSLTDRLFRGLDKAVKVHKRIGVASVLLGALHPVTLTVFVMEGQGGAFSSVWAPTRLVVLLGLGALFGSVIVVAMTRVKKMRHQNWMRIHRLLGWFLLFIIGHLLVSRGDVYYSDGLYAYLLGLSTLGFASFVYTSVLGRWLIPKYQYEIVEANSVNDSVVELVVKPIGPRMHYLPGQYAYVQLEGELTDGEAHPFSFATSDDGPYIRFGIKALGDFTSKLRSVTAGTRVYLRGPFGGFHSASIKATTQIWIAGGVGITPFLSMARSLSKEHNGKIILLYGCKDLDDAVFLHELKEIANIRKDVFEVYAAFENINGYVDVAKVAATAHDFVEAEYLVCGPPAMMTSIKKALIKNGVGIHQIHIEEFSY